MVLLWIMESEAKKPSGQIGGSGPPLGSAAEIYQKRFEKRRPRALLKDLDGTAIPDLSLSRFLKH